MNPYPAAMLTPTTFSGHDLTCVRGERRIFARLNFELAAGDALLLLGPNGSGKSSLLRLMAGLLRAAAGHPAWNGLAADEDPETHHQRLHYVGHHDAVKPVLTVAESLRFWSRLHDGDSDERLRLALDRFGLTRLADMPGRMLSAGQKRRTNLARLIAAPAPLWLLDEPSVALDRASVKTLEGLIAEHRANGGMVAVSTHTDLDLPGARELLLDRFSAPPEDDQE
jgi:heme exporter protein A